ncbi:Nuclear pore complex nucleoporin component [Coemansia sp. RSA 564]|nr:Nuclear pore complex nucleoporin component [Coemansia sp. RSA 564]
MNSDYGAFMEKCAHYTTCKSCTSDRRCGYFFDTGVCVPGGWLAPRGNYTNSGDAWSYYHGHCFISTRKEFVMLPAICGLLILMLAVAALWQSWPARWFGFSLRGPTTPRASPGRGPGNMPNVWRQPHMMAAKYQWNDNGDIKSEGIYAERMTGMHALFAAIVQMPDIGGQPNPFPVHHGWTWLVRIINMPPWAISPLLVQTFLSVAGPTMLGVYGRQMDKLISVLATTWIASVVNLSPLTVAGKSNLTTFFDEYRSLGNIRKCKGHVIKTC